MIRFALVCAVALAAPIAAAQQAPAPDAEAAPSPFDIQYPDVPTARAQVTGLSNAQAHEVEDGRLIVLTALDSTQLEFWEFVAPTDPAYPAVVRRRMRMEPTGLMLQRSILCQAATDACDAWKKRLTAEEAELSAQMSREMIEYAKKEHRRMQRYREAARNNYGR